MLQSTLPTTDILEDASMTPLDKPLRRELKIADHRYTLTIDSDGLKLTKKGAATA
jgi:hypothetical protein